jgi:hypothetical protein
MPSLITIYSSISKKKKGKFLSDISLELCIGYVTLQQKLGKLKNDNHDTFTKLEKERLSLLLNTSIEELFSEPAL